MAAAAVVLVVGGVVAVGVVGSRDAVAPDAAITTSTDTDRERAAVDTVATVHSAAPLASTLDVGSSGDDVVHLQQRLTDLGVQPGPVDGQFGTETQQAVWAFKKLAGNITWTEFASADDQSSVDEAVWQQMNDPSFAVVPRRPDTGRHVEIYLPLQVLALFDETNKPVFVAHVSTGEQNADGTDVTFCERITFTTDSSGQPLAQPETKAMCGESKTPPGVFQLVRYADGLQTSPLGGMKNPWYFNYGIAIHGAQHVPDRPASHGAVRISNNLADTFPALVDKGDAVYVWGHDGREPVDLGRSGQVRKADEDGMHASFGQQSVPRDMRVDSAGMMRGRVRLR
jgi:hypothetical protein